MHATWPRLSLVADPFLALLLPPQILTAVHLFTTDIAEVRLCSGFSMLPTFSHQGDLVLISPIPVKWHASSYRAAERGDAGAVSSTGLMGIHRGDVVVATSPTDPRRTVCKRVLGLEGDIVEVDPLRKRRGRDRAGAGASSEKRWEEVDAEHRKALAHGAAGSAGDPQEAQAEVLVPVFTRRQRDNEHVRIPRGHVWLAGDNLSNSTDSRAYGPVPLALVKGKVLARVGPGRVLIANGARAEIGSGTQVWPNPKWIDNPITEIEAAVA